MSSNTTDNIIAAGSGVAGSILAMVQAVSVSSVLEVMIYSGVSAIVGLTIKSAWDYVKSKL